MRSDLLGLDSVFEPVGADLTFDNFQFADMTSSCRASNFEFYAYCTILVSTTLNTRWYNESWETDRIKPPRQ
jgi:hypothetical protein